MQKAFGTDGAAEIPVIPGYETFDSQPMVSAPEHFDRTLFGYSYGDEAQIAALDSAGKLDATFGSGGFITFPYAALIDVKVDLDDRVLALYENGGFYISRFNSDGSLDAAFGSMGTIDLSADFSLWPYGLGVDSNRNICVFGFHDANSVSVARVDAYGNIDSSFGSGGMTSVMLSALPNTTDAQTMAVASDNSIFVTAQTTLSTGHSMLQVIKLDNSGNEDLSFAGGSGVLSIDAFPSAALGSYTEGTSAAFDEVGDLVIVGGASDGVSVFGMAVSRITAAGDVDMSFNSGSPLVRSDPVYSYEHNQPTVLVDGRGKLIVTGTANDGLNIHPFAIRLNGDGTTDASFGGGTGQVIVPSDTIIGRTSIGHGGDIIMFGENRGTSTGIALDLTNYDLPPVLPPTHF